MKDVRAHLASLILWRVEGVRSATGEIPIRYAHHYLGTMVGAGSLSPGRSGRFRTRGA